MVPRMALGLLVVVFALLAAIWDRSAPPLPGFTKERAQAHRDLERRFLTLPSPEHIREAHRVLAGEPHLAGSTRDRQLAEWTAQRFREVGLDEVQIVEHEVLLPWPDDVSVQMTVPRAWRASMYEDPIAGDRYTHAPPDRVGPAYHAYSASGEVSAPVVYAGSGEPEDYDWLARQGIDVRGTIALVRHSVPYSYRGFKAWTAQQRGVAGLLMYSDPQEDGATRGPVYPDGPWGPESRIQRGGIAYDFLVPGDPLTPGWPSVPGAQRIARGDAVTLPKIVSAPLSQRDARAILESLGGPEVPREWRGALPITYRAGAGPSIVNLRVRLDDRVRPVWTVTGLLRGSGRPDDLVIVGNHRDAWIHGGVDPSSGSAAMMELARTLGELKRTGWRPARSIMFASWDAEEFALTSSTEWGEQHAALLRDRAVAYLNVDSAASGPDLNVSATPALNPVIEEAARIVRDPGSRLTLASRARDRVTRERDAPATGAPDDWIENRLGGGSDYTVFLNHLGVPIADLSFTGPYGVYHSLYDTHQWVATFGDPGFRYHTALVQLWGLIAIRLADADVAPLDYVPYAEQIDQFATEVDQRAVSTATHRQTFADLRAAIDDLRAAASELNRARAQALETSDRPSLSGLNERLMTAERALLDPQGLAGRPWYRHLIYAPKYTYAPQVLPGVSEAVDSGETVLAAAETRRLVSGLRRAASALRGR